MPRPTANESELSRVWDLWSRIDAAMGSKLLRILGSRKASDPDNLQTPARAALLWRKAKHWQYGTTEPRGRVWHQ